MVKGNERGLFRVLSSTYLYLLLWDSTTYPTNLVYFCHGLVYTPALTAREPLEIPMKTLILAMIALSSTSAIAGVSPFTVQNLECEMKNAAGTSRITMRGGEDGKIETNMGDAGFDKVTGSYFGGILAIDLSYTSRIYWGQEVNLKGFLSAPDFERQKKNTAYKGMMYALVKANVMIPMMPFPGPGSYPSGGYGIGGMYPGGFNPTAELPVGAVPVGFLECQVDAR
jgi:hypothetical protein